MTRSAFGQWLDLFRWVAAFVVLYGHTINLFMVRASDVKGEKSILHLMAAFPTGFAQQAVMVFFVISGLLVGGELFNEWRERGRVNATNYLIKRFSRLWAVLLPIYLVTIFCNWVGLSYSSSVDYYRSDTWQTMSPASLLCNATFLQTVLCRQYGNNGPLWSLFNEFWYYVTWLGFIWALTRPKIFQRIGWMLLTSLIIIILTYYQFGGAPLAPYMLIWLLGVVVVWSPRPFIRSVSVSAAIMVMCLLAIRLGVRREFWDANPVWTFVLDFTAAATFGNLLLSMRAHQNLPPPPASKVFSKLAAFSFTLYCIHEPLLYLYGSIFDIEKVLPDSFKNIVTIFSPIIGIVFIAWLFSLITEEQTFRVRRFLQRIAGQPGGAPTAHSAN